MLCDGLKQCVCGEEHECVLDIFSGDGLELTFFGRSRITLRQFHFTAPQGVDQVRRQRAAIVVPIQQGQQKRYRPWQGNGDVLQGGDPPLAFGDL